MADNNNNDKKKLDDNALADVAGGVTADYRCEKCGGTSFEARSTLLVKCTKCGYIQKKFPYMNNPQNPQDIFNN